MKVGVAGRIVNGFVVAHTEKGDDCEEDGHDEEEEGKVLIIICVLFRRGEGRRV